MHGLHAIPFICYFWLLTTTFPTFVLFMQRFPAVGCTECRTNNSVIACIACIACGRVIAVGFEADTDVAPHTPIAQCLLCLLDLWHRPLERESKCPRGQPGATLFLAVFVVGTEKLGLCNLGGCCLDGVLREKDTHRVGHGLELCPRIAHRLGLGKALSPDTGQYR